MHQCHERSRPTRGKIKLCVICLLLSAIYAPTESALTHEKDHFSNALDSIMTRVSSRDHLLVLVDANARTGQRENFRADSKVFGGAGMTD